MALETLMLALLLGASAEATQSHAAAQSHAAPAKPEPAAAQKPHGAAPTAPAAPTTAEPKASESKSSDTHSAPAAAHGSAPAPAAAASKAAASKAAPGSNSDLMKLAADLAAAKDALIKPRAIQVTSRPRGTPRPGAARPPARRYQLRWPSFDERWRVTWPQDSPDRLALVWPE